MITESETHRAVVTNVSDPEKRGRLKVKCQSLVGASTELPQWAEPDATAFSSLGGASALWLPVVGATVNIVVDVKDVGMDQHKERFMLNPGLRWLPAPPTETRGPMPIHKSLQTHYPDRRGYVTKQGLMIILDDSTKSMIIGRGESKDTVTITPDSIQLDLDGTIFDVISGKVRIGGSEADQKLVKGTLFWMKLSTCLLALATALASMQAAAQGPLAGFQPGLAAAVQALTQLNTDGAAEAFLSDMGYTK